MSTKGQNIDVSMCSFHGVVVYQDRAEIKREICVNVKGGESEIIITGLSESIDGDSIRLVAIISCINLYIYIYIYTYIYIT